MSSTATVPAYTVIDKRGQAKDVPEPGHSCRVCGCPTAEHSKTYNSPTMECIKYLRQQISDLKAIPVPAV